MSRDKAPWIGRDGQPVTVVAAPKSGGAVRGCLTGIGGLVVLALVLVVGITILGSSSGSSMRQAAPDSSQPAQSSDVPATTGTSPVPQTTALPKVGETVSNADGAMLTVFSFGPVPPADLGYDSHPGQFEAIVKVCAGKSGLNVNPFDFSIVDSDNVRHEATPGATNNGFSSTNLAAGDCVKGGVGLTIPSGFTPKALLYDGGTTGTTKASARYTLVP